MTLDPTVSVIVPVRNRREMLRDLLKALDNQSYDNFEVIVVDDGSTDGSEELARDAVVRGKPVKVVESGGRGALPARQLGVEHSTSDILAFTDSDCVPDPGWLEHAVAAMVDGAEMVNGYTKPARPLRPMERSMASGTEGLYPTCNMFFRRDLYDRLGGFDAAAADRWRFRATAHARGTGFGEDTLLGWQAVRSGADTRYVPEAVVEHQVFPPDPKEFISRLTQVAAFPAMTKEIPELRRTLMRKRVFLGNHARVPVYLTALALLLRRRGLAALAVGWWVSLHVRRYQESPYPLAEQLPWLPVDMATDVMMAGALVAGSVSAREVVL
ncbi:MAG TPA: glycosyltransferase family A protein [Acidimicrobiales bacterium]|nr:glycosyltransferase family A protein [Acidimicrobiales bacterium]